MSNIPACSWVKSDKIRPSRWNAEFYKSVFTELEVELESSGFDTKKLGDLGRLFTGPFGSKLPARLYNTVGGVPLLRVQNIGNLFLNESNMALIPHDVHLDIIRSKLETGDIALAKAGRLGALSRIPEHVKECNITQHIVGVKVNKNKINPSYLCAFLMSKYGEFQLKRQAVGTIIKYLGIDETRDARVSCPDERIQLYIGGKIELAEKAKRESDYCEEKARSHFLSDWRSSNIKLTGYFATISDVQLITNDRLDAEFYRPDLVSMRKRVVSNKSGHVVVGNCGRVFAGKTPADKDVDSGSVEIVRVANLTNHGLDWGNKLFGSANKGFLADGDIIICKDAHQKYYIGQQVDIFCRNGFKAVASSETLVIRFDKEKVNPFAALIYLRTEEGYSAFQQQIRGTSAHLYPADVEKIVIPKISDESSEAIEKLIRRAEHCRITSFQLIENIKSDVESLIEGKLDTVAIMSGKLKAPTWEDIEKELEGI